MRERTEFFLMNKKSDFISGYPKRTENEFSESGVTVKDYYFSDIFDSRKKNMMWYKLEGRFSVPESCSLKLFFYSSDSMDIDTGKESVPIISVLNSSMSLEQKRQALSSLNILSSPAYNEILLTSMRGRYFFFLAVSMSTRSEYPVIERIKLRFAPHMWINFLPEIYRSYENSFTEKYLAVFQSIFEDIEKRIDRSYENYSPDTASFELLKWLSQWYCTTEPELWNEDQLRYILKNARRIYKNLGTAAVIKELVSLYLGKEVEIIEYWQKDDNEIIKKYRGIKQNLFTDPYCFMVIVSAETMSDSEYERLMRIIDSCKPAYMQAEIILVSPRLFRCTVIEDGTELSEKNASGISDGIILS